MISFQLFRHAQAREVALLVFFSKLMEDAAAIRYNVLACNFYISTDIWGFSISRLT